MSPESSSSEVFEQAPDPDIQQAVHHAQTNSAEGFSEPDLEVGDTLAASGCPFLGLRYVLTKCGLIAEKYPWQTTTAFLLTIAAGWVCAYFGVSLLLGLILTAMSMEE